VDPAAVVSEGGRPKWKACVNVGQLLKALEDVRADVPVVFRAGDFSRPLTVKILAKRVVVKGA
jgi:hypothetical protein